jgi:hypothetical protein
MALVATNSTKEPRSFSIGPVKIQIMTYAAASADVSGTITADALSTVLHIIIDGLQQTTAASFSGNVVTLAFQDPAATVSGTVILIGK